MIYYHFYLEKLALSAVWRTWDHRDKGGCTLRPDRSYLSISVIDGGGGLGQSGYDDHGEMQTDLSGI